MDINITTLYKEYYPKLLYYARKFLPYDHQKAEEIVDDVFLKVRGDRHIHKTGLSKWLYTCVHNACLLHLEPKRIIIYSDMLIESNVQEEYDYNEVKAEVINQLYEYIEKLPSVCRRIFELHYFEEKQNQEIADIMGLKLQTVKNQLRIALQKLRGAFGMEYESLKDRIVKLHEKGYSRSIIKYKLSTSRKEIQSVLSTH